MVGNGQQTKDNVIVLDDLHPVGRVSTRSTALCSITVSAKIKLYDGCIRHRYYYLGGCRKADDDASQITQHNRDSMCKYTRNAQRRHFATLEAAYTILFLILATSGDQEMKTSLFALRPSRVMKSRSNTP